MRRCPALLAASEAAMAESLAFLQEELQPGVRAWRAACREDPELLVTPTEVLSESLAWLEEFLWNGPWATGFGRQALSDAIQHRPSLLTCGADAHEETAAWLERHGLDDAAVRSYTAGALSPFPTEPFPWIELLQLGAARLERGAAWLEEELGWSREEVAAALCREPSFLLAAATAAGASKGPPMPGYPLPEPRETWQENHAKAVKVAAKLELEEGIKVSPLKNGAEAAPKPASAPRRPPGKSPQASRPQRAPPPPPPPPPPQS